MEPRSIFACLQFRPGRSGSLQACGNQDRLMENEAAARICVPCLLLAAVFAIVALESRDAIRACPTEWPAHGSLNECITSLERLRTDDRYNS